MGTGRAVVAACAAYALAMTALGAIRYATYHSGADLGEFVQTIATPFSGFGDVPEGGSHFLHHFSPILYLCSPVLLMAHSALALIAIQALAGALAIPPVYLLVRRRAVESVALLAAVVTLFYPPLVGVTFTDFHENGFAPAAIAWLAWAVDGRRWRLAAVFVALALAIKEDEALMLAVLGAGFWWWARRRGDAAFARFAALTAAAGVAVLALYFLVVWPLAGGRGTWFVLGYLSASMPHQSGIDAVLGRASYLLEALVPLLFVPFAGPHALYVLPGLAEVLSSRWSITYTMGQHYAGVWVGEMVVAFGLTLAAIAASRGERFARRLGAGALAVCILNLSLASPTHWRHYVTARTHHHAVLDAFVAAIPADATVGSHDEIYAHLGFVRGAQIGIDPLPDLILVDQTYDSTEWRERFRPRLAALVAAGSYALVRGEDGVELYRRRGT